MNGFSVVIERALGFVLVCFFVGCAIGSALAGEIGRCAGFALVTWAMLCVINWREGK